MKKSDTVEGIQHFHEAIGRLVMKTVNTMEGIRQAREALGCRATITTTSKVIPPGHVMAPDSDIPPGHVMAPGNDIPPGHVMAPGNVIPSGHVMAPGNVIPSGHVMASGNVIPPGHVMAPGNDIPPGHVMAPGNVIPSGHVLASGNVIPSGKATPPNEVAAASKADLTPYKRLFIRIASECTRNGFRIDDQNREIIRSLFLYFLGQPGPLDPRKGLWLSGPVGTGKSTLMFIFSRFMRALGEGFLVHVCSQVTTAFSLSGDLDKYLNNRSGYLGTPVALCFDELGREPIPAKYFGTELNVMQHLLHIRYSYWQTEGLKTYVTTNLFPDEVELKYGDYIRDRRKEMFNLIKLDGLSRR